MAQEVLSYRQLNKINALKNKIFEAWLKKYANTPEGLIAEMAEFANMEI